MTEDRILKNYTQVRDYLIGLGYNTNFYRVKMAVERRELLMRKGGGWTTAQAEKWARAFLDPPPDMSPDADAPSGEGAEDYGVSEAKARMQIKNLEEDHRRKVFDNDREIGRYTLTTTIKAELGARARAFRLGLERFGQEKAEEVAAVFGGAARPAQELARRLGMEGQDAVRAQALIQDFCLERSSRFSAQWMTMVERFLDAYAEGHWWDDDMRAAWEKFEEHGNASADQ